MVISRVDSLIAPWRADSISFSSRGDVPEDPLVEFSRLHAAQKSPWTFRPHIHPPMRSHVEFAGLGDPVSGMSRMRLSPLAAEYQPHRSDCMYSRCLGLFNVRAGSGHLHARGATTAFKPSSAIVTTTGEPHALVLDSAGALVSFHVPFDRITVPEPELRRLAFTVLARQHACSPLLLPDPHTLMHAGTLNAEGLDHYLAGAMDLFVRTAAGLAPDHADTATARRHQVERYIQDHLMDPNLGPQRIATALQISTRLVHKLFEHQPQTVHELIQHKRVELAGHLLASPKSHIALDEVARRSGFGSTRTLVRAFLRIHDTTPSAYRA